MLEDIGLTEGEIKVYLALLKLGSTTTGPIAKESEVSASKVYKILDRLQKKGLVGQSIEGKIKHFKPMPPRNILDYIDERNRKFEKQKEAVEKMLPELESQQHESKKTQTTLYEGIKAIKNFYLNILNDLSAGESYYVLGATYGENRPGVKEFYQNYHMQRVAKKIRVKMLANFDTKGKLVPATLKLSEIRFLPQYFITNMTILFYKHRAFIFFLTEEPAGFLIESEEAVNNLKVYFDTFWKIAKK